ncbi:hypothetical protein BDC45DRAFT_544029 [Circinella umbellata]|nr:hypothetical protein BDC45DRAFT_544029 [Circinella umbellata]
MYRDIKTLPTPSGWTPEVKYIDKLIWSSEVPKEVRMSYEPKAAKMADEVQSPRFLSDHVNVRGSSYSSIKEQRRNIRIKKITDKSHPCCGAYGLYAAQTLQPRQLILDYLGVVEYQTYDSSSDYVLRYGTDLSIDAAKCGNEARFCNDFRGIGSGPNVCFLNYMDENTRQIRVGIFVAGNSKIRKGEELLVTYGKSFWTNRGMNMHENHHSSKKH